MGIVPYASYTLTKRFTDIGSLGKVVSFAEWAIKKLFIHFEGTTTIFHIKGRGTVTGSGDAHWTSNGTTIELDGMWDAGATICTLYTPTANGASKTLTGDFASDANWTKNTWTIGGGVATHPTGVADALVETSSTVVNGEQYLLTYTIKTTTTAGVLTPSAGGVTLTARSKAISAVSATYTEEFTAVSTAALAFTSDALWAGTIDDVSLCKVTPVVVSLLAWR